MKAFFIFSITMISALFMLNAQAKHSTEMEVRMEGQEAKNIYAAMSAVQGDGAAGHIYKQGKNILCRYTDADMDDSQGKPIPSGDSRRYACAMRVDKYGLISSPQSF